MKHLEKINNKKIIITGGLGFIGYNLAKTLVNTYKCKVTIVDDCSNSSEKVIEKFIGDIGFHKISVLDTERLFPLLHEVNYIFHLACKQISASGKEPVEDLKVNAQSTLHILEFLRNNPSPNLERFLYTSSCSIYGSSNIIPTSENGIFNIKSNYAATKLLGEHYVQIYNTLYEIPTTIVRYSNVYGPGQTANNPYCGVVGKFINSALKGEPLKIFGDGEQTRDYTYINDAVNATILTAVHPKSYGEIFNIGTTTETSVNKIVEIIKETIPTVKTEYVKERDIDNIRRRAINIEKIQQKLGWTPQTGVHKGMEETIHWVKQNH